MEHSNRSVEVPVVKEVGVRKRIVEVPEVHVVEKVQPKVRLQEVVHRVPKFETVQQIKYVEVPDPQIIEHIVEVPEIHEVIRHVPRIETQEVQRVVPRYRYEVIEKYVEVPHIEVVDKIVEVPEMREVIREVRRKQIVEIPVEKIVHVPRVEIQTVEKIRHVPGEIEYRDIPIDCPVRVPVIQTVEKIVEIQTYEDVEYEVEVAQPVPGEIIEIPHEVIEYVDKIITQEVPGNVIRKEVPYDVEKIVEIPVPQPQEIVRVVRKEVPFNVERVVEIDQPIYFDEYIDVPEPVPQFEPPTIITPKFVENIRHFPDIYETAEPRMTYERGEELPPIFEQLPPKVVDDAPPYLRGNNVFNPLGISSHRIPSNGTQPLPQRPMPPPMSTVRPPASSSIVSVRPPNSMSNKSVKRQPPPSVSKMSKESGTTRSGSGGHRSQD